MITGNDSTSFEVIKLLNNGYPHKEIANKLTISLDNVKRLSRYNNICTNLYPYISKESFKILQNLGTKSLVLSRFIKTKEYHIFETILNNISVSITRSQLQQIVNKVMFIYEKTSNEKKVLVNELKETKEQLIFNQQQLNDSIERLNHKEVFRLLKDCDQFTSDFLQNYIGICNGKLALMRRINPTWQSSLKRQKIIEYNPSSFVWEIKDVGGFIARASNRLRENKPVKFDLNDLSDFQMSNIYKNSRRIYILDRYKNVKDTLTVTRNKIKEYEELIQENNDKIYKLENKIAEVDTISEKQFSAVFDIQDNTIENSIVTYLKFTNAFEPLNNKISIEQVAKELANFINVTHNLPV